jgi:hypothetical protein
MAAALHAVGASACPRQGCNLDEARRFLKRLDPNATVFTFATFTDTKEKPRPDPLARIQTGTFEELAPWLERHNMLGAGVFVTVNETDGTGRKKENIVRIRALWQEADRGDEPELPVEPHMVIESSPGKFHRYVLVRDGVLDEFESVQRRLVDDYGSDPNAKDRSRVLRLPGFYHMKNPDSPHLVRIVSTSEEPRAWDELKERFPPVVRPERTTALARTLRPIDGSSPLNPVEIASASWNIWIPISPTKSGCRSAWRCTRRIRGRKAWPSGTRGAHGVPSIGRENRSTAGAPSMPIVRAG